MKKIALDLDGVVFDTENLYRVYTEIYDVEHFKSDNIIDNTSRMFQNRYSWNEKDFTDFYNIYSQEILKNAHEMTGFSVVLKKLINHFEFVVITARKDNELKFASDFFKSLNINIDIYNNCSKIDKCLELNVDYIIDDEPSTCTEASKKGIVGIYLKNNASNYLKENDYLKNVHNWGEIYKYLMLGDKNENKNR